MTTDRQPDSGPGITGRLAIRLVPKHSLQRQNYRPPSNSKWCNVIQMIRRSVANDSLRT
jgi:hypothetical protein